MNDTESPSKSSKAMKLRRDEEKSDERKENGMEEDKDNRGR